jgi:hypothetical protein
MIIYRNEDRFAMGQGHFRQCSAVLLSPVLAGGIRDFYHDWIRLLLHVRGEDRPGSESRLDSCILCGSPALRLTPIPGRHSNLQGLSPSLAEMQSDEG